MKRVGAVIVLTLAAQTALAANTFNAFRGTIETESPVKQPVKNPPLPKATLPALPAYTPPTTAYTATQVPSALPPLPQQTAEGKNEKNEKDSWRIVGRIGDQITVSNQHGDKAVVPDGTMKAGCFIAYPDIFCEKADIAEAKKRIAAETRAREEEEATINAQKEKIRDLQDMVAKMRKEMNTAFEEAARLKTTSAQLATQTRYVEELQSTAEKLRKQLEASNADAKMLSKQKESLEKLQDKDRQAQVRIAELEKELHAAKSHESKLQVEIVALKNSINATPDWVKGTPKEYDDALLGKIYVRRQGGEIFFAVDNAQEPSADNVFGKKVLRKEKRGRFTYYALNAKAVRFKE